MGDPARDAAPKGLFCAPRWEEVGTGEEPPPTEKSVQKREERDGRASGRAAYTYLAAGRRSKRAKNADKRLGMVWDKTKERRG